MRETQAKRTPDPAVGDRKITRAHSATEVKKAIFDVYAAPGARPGTCFDGRRPQAAKVVVTETAH
jgi:hypothetical protein